MSWFATFKQGLRGFGSCTTERPFLLFCSALAFSFIGRFSVGFTSFENVSSTDTIGNWESSV